MNSIGSQNKDALQQYLEETEDEPESVETFATEPHPGPDATGNSFCNLLAFHAVISHSLTA